MHKIKKIRGLENGLWGVHYQRDKYNILSTHVKLVDAIKALKATKAVKDVKDATTPIEANPLW